LIGDRVYLAEADIVRRREMIEGIILKDDTEAGAQFSAI